MPVPVASVASTPVKPTAISPVLSVWACISIFLQSTSPPSTTSVPALDTVLTRSAPPVYHG